VTDRAKARPKEYIRPISPTWWLARPAYTWFMVRELTSAFIAGYAVFLLILMARARDPAAFSSLIEGLKSPLSIILHLIVLAFALYHTITFFNLAPRVLVVQRGEERVPDAMISGANYLAWVIVSVVLFIIAVRL
jgi:succinate dehydrogenase subunit C